MRINGPVALDVETSGEKRIDTADPRRAKFEIASLWPAGGGVVTHVLPVVEPGAEVVVHNVPYDPVVLGCWDARWDDTKVLAHLAGEPDTTLKGLTLKFLGRPAMRYEEAVRRGELDAYCLADSQNTWELRPILYDNLRPETRELYDELERPMLPVWARMTLEGSYFLDVPELRAYAMALTAEVELCELAAQRALPRGREVVRCTICGKRAPVEQGQRCESGRLHRWKGGAMYDPDEPVNLNSPEQLLDALRTSGISVDSTGAEVLGPLRADPLVDAVLSYREKQKELSTYIEPWLTVPEGARLGAVWRPTGVRNGGRVASAYPNLQNIPARLEHFWLPATGAVFITFDNSQLEVRIAAQLSQDPILVEACYSSDFHQRMMRAFGLTEKRREKVWLFGSLYLGGPGLLVREAAKSGITMTWSEAEAAQAIVHRTLPAYYDWAAQMTELRVVPGLFGAYHYIPPFGDEAGQGRQAVNDPIQAGAGRVTKRQMLALARAGYRIRSQVHDSVTVEVPLADKAAALVDVKRIMEDVGGEDLDIPIVVEYKGS